MFSVNMRISAVICTLNRAVYLRKALRSLVDQTLPEEGYEILVVDNGSTDGTRQVVVGEFSSVQNLRYLYEPIEGLSQARNAGWTSASGKYVAYLDDDAIACPQWLERILHVFETVTPTPGCVGGKVEPIWEAPRPSWLPDKMLSYLTILDWSKNSTTLKDSQWLAGANVAFPKRLLEATGGFQVDLDRRGDKLLSNGDVLLERQLQNRGYCCFYHPEILVWHHIPAGRVTKRWFRRRVYWQGVSAALTRMHQESPSTLQRLWMGIAAGRSILLSPRGLAYLGVPTNHPGRFAQKSSTLQQIGYMLGLFGIVK